MFNQNFKISLLLVLAGISFGMSIFYKNTFLNFINLVFILFLPGMFLAIQGRAAKQALELMAFSYALSLLITSIFFWIWIHVAPISNFLTAFISLFFFGTALYHYKSKIEFRHENIRRRYLITALLPIYFIILLIQLANTSSFYNYYALDSFNMISLSNTILNSKGIDFTSPWYHGGELIYPWAVHLWVAALSFFTDISPYDLWRNLVYFNTGAFLILLAGFADRFFRYSEYRINNESASYFIPISALLFVLFNAEYFVYPVTSNTVSIFIPLFLIYVQEFVKNRDLRTSLFMGLILGLIFISRMVEPISIFGFLIFLLFYLLILRSKNIADVLKPFFLVFLVGGIIGLPTFIQTLMQGAPGVYIPSGIAEMLSHIKNSLLSAASSETGSSGIKNLKYALGLYSIWMFALPLGIAILIKDINNKRASPNSAPILYFIFNFFITFIIFFGMLFGFIPLNELFMTLKRFIQLGLIGLFPVSAYIFLKVWEIVKNQTKFGEISKKIILIIFIFILILPGLPYVSFYVFELTTHNKQFTISPKEFQSLEWIQKNTQADSVFLVSLKNTYLPTFGMRSVYITGPYITSVVSYEVRKIEKRSRFVEDVYSNRYTPKDLASEFKERNIEYIYIGPLERLSNFSYNKYTESDLFEIAFQNSEVVVVKLKNG